MVIWISITVIIIVIWTFHKYRFGHWKRKGIPYQEPLPLFGNVIDVVLQRKSLAHVNLDIYKRLGNHKVGGIYFFYRPVLLVKDTVLIKHILTTDFSHFSDRASFLITEGEPITRHLFNLTGEQWKTLRAKLTPTFTSGKLKLMFYLIKDNAQALNKVLGKLIDDGRGDNIEMKEIIERYSTDVISSCVFGLEANSMENPHSEFKKMGETAFKPTWKSMIRHRLFLLSSQLAKFVAPSDMSPQVSNFFLSLISQVVEYREKSIVARNDFVDLLIGLRNEKPKQLLEGLGDPHDYGNNNMTIEFMAAQCYSFFAAGFEPSTSTISLTLYELSRNVNIQNKLYEEISEVLSCHKGNVTYESIKEMKYLDKVICETLRMYPSLMLLFRECTKTYEIPNSDITIENGTTVLVPVYGIHYDPQYYPNPSKFNPENFSDEAKASRPSYTYFPFGGGPRICIGSRFGMMQVKLGIVTLLKNYEFRTSKNMEEPIKHTSNLLVSKCNNIWLKCVRRVVNNEQCHI